MKYQEDPAPFMGIFRLQLCGLVQVTAGLVLAFITITVPAINPMIRLKSKRNFLNGMMVNFYMIRK
jgi:hypothetical protein